MLSVNESDDKFKVDFALEVEESRAGEMHRTLVSR